MIFHQNESLDVIIWTPYSQRCERGNPRGMKSFLALNHTHEGQVSAMKQRRQINHTIVLSSILLSLGACTTTSEEQVARATPPSQANTSWQTEEPTQATTLEEASPSDPAASTRARPPASPSRATTPRQRTNDFIVHEWGTYTSVQSSLGVTLDGMMHEEEPLPAFVHARDPSRLFAKGMEVVPEWINQKLETPVIYFHGEPNQKVRVEVDFPKGIISEWYPKASSFRPGIGEINKIADGQMTWEGELLEREPNMIQVSPDEIWAPSRQVDALPFAAAGSEEEERFIFYRGIGRFDMPIRTKSTSGDRFTISNESDEEIPAVFVLHVSEHGGTVRNLGTLPGGGSVVASPTPKEMPLANYEEEAHRQVKEALVASGLYEDEALAMVNTWRRSYFKTPGTRVLYIAPRSWTDELLPLRISPTPTETVRTLVGRIEVMTAADEARTVEQIQAAASSNLSYPETLERLGRFADPRLRRVCTLIEDPRASGYCWGVQKFSIQREMGATSAN